MSEKVLSGLKDGIQMPVAWNWDHRFSAALAIVSDEQAQGVITRLRNTMSEVNHSESLEFDGKDLTGLSQHLGNLRGLADDRRGVVDDVAGVVAHDEALLVAHLLLARRHEEGVLGVHLHTRHHGTRVHGDQ